MSQQLPDTPANPPTASAPDSRDTAQAHDEQRDQIESIGAYMREHGLLLTTAESCTAGLIAARLADLPGTGSLLECAFVVYSPDAKQNCLGVPAELLERVNLTSEAVAAAMAQGALLRSKANLAIANTGVADDTDPKTPAGTQCFAWAFDDPPSGLRHMLTGTVRFAGDRNSIREQAARYALCQIPEKHALAVRHKVRAQPADASAKDG
ncbi:MAG: hypothetical protein JWP47_31 [Polaromonas sp.]|nr:hypothetical protein [Polaromonas sp.]